MRPRLLRATLSAEVRPNQSGLIGAGKTSPKNGQSPQLLFNPLCKKPGAAARGGKASGAPNVELLLKRQTWNTNRAIVVAALPEVPSDFASYLRGLRRWVAFRCGFFPFFWGIGIQVILVVPGLARSSLDPTKHAARMDNQWAIVQSVFLVDPSAQIYRSARTWGQFVTGKSHDAIAGVLEQYFQLQNL